MYFWAVIAVNNPKVLAKLLVKTTIRSLRGMEEKRLVLNTNLISTKDIRMLVRDWAKANSLDATPRFTCKSFARVFDKVKKIRNELTKRKTFDIGRSLFVDGLTERSLNELMFSCSLFWKLVWWLTSGLFYQERCVMWCDCGILSVFLREKLWRLNYN